MLLLVSIETSSHGYELGELNLGAQPPNLVVQGPLDLHTELVNHVHLQEEAWDVDIIISGHFV